MSASAALDEGAGTHAEWLGFTEGGVLASRTWPLRLLVEDQATADVPPGTIGRG